jgi:hypothetical protein
VRILVKNRDNAPVRVSGVKVLTAERSLVFTAAEPGTYTLFAGNPEARTPDYDLEEILTRSGGVSPVEVSVAAWQPNPGYQPHPLPFSERARAWLTPLLVVFAVLIGVAAALLIRRARHPH